MPLLVQDLTAEVLDLPAQDRAKILELLISSFETKSSAQKVWMDIALHRREQVRLGQVSMLVGAEVLTRVRAKLA